MKELSRQALIARLLGEMEEAGSWGGRTHLHKSLYAFQHLFGGEDADIHQFQLYRHGPYAFGLDDDVAAMEFCGTIKRVDEPPYGPHYRRTTGGKLLIQRFGNLSPSVEEQLQFIARKISTLKVRQLEALCTLMFVLDEANAAEPTAEHLNRVQELKPHLMDIELMKAVEAYRGLRKEATSLK